MRLIDFIIPTNFTCVCCHKENYFDGGICKECFDKLPYISGKTCRYCGVAISGDYAVCHNCKTDEDRYYEKCNCLFYYKNEIAYLLSGLKQDGRKYLAEVLGRFLIEKIKNYDEEIDIITTVPLHKNRQKQRGFNQSEMLLKKLDDDRLDNNILVRIKDIPNQTSLNKEHRKLNIIDAFKVVNSRKVKGKNILLIDDIFTTGSTSNECSRMLKLAGAKNVYVLCLARKPIKNDTIKQ